VIARLSETVRPLKPWPSPVFYPLGGESVFLYKSCTLQQKQHAIYSYFELENHLKHYTTYFNSFVQSFFE